MARKPITQGDALTAKQQAVWDMRRPVADGGLGKPISEIADAMGVGVPAINKSLKVTRKKLGITTGRPVFTRSTEEARPEVAAAAIEAASDPVSKSQADAIDRVNEELKNAGIPGKVSAAIVRRMRARYGNLISVKKQITTNEILKAIDEQIHLIDSYIDDKVCAESNLRDLGLVKAAFIEKRNLLRGEPTQIITNTDRKKLEALIPMLVAEGQRRGITVEGRIMEKVVSP